MIYPITGWFEVKVYKDEQAMMITNLVETTWLTWYPWFTKITYDQVS